MAGFMSVGFIKNHFLSICYYSLSVFFVQKIGTPEEDAKVKNPGTFSIAFLQHPESLHNLTKRS